jgi:GAF domain-containing protein
MADDSALLDALRRFAHDMSVDYDLSDVLYRLTDDVTAVVGVAGAGIAVSDEEDQLRYATASSDQIATLEGVQEEHQMGPCAEAFNSQRPVVVVDISTRADWPEYRKTAESLGFASVAGLPLSLSSERLGALNLYDRQVREWSDDELSTARVLADMAAGFMVHERLERSRQLSEQLRYALDSRIIIEQAKGILAAERRVTVDEAFDVLRQHSRNNNTSLRTIAQAVVEDGFRPEEPPAR